MHAPNLFLATRFDLPEEDRLTSALVAVLAHADRRVLAAFLSAAAGEPVAIAEPVEFRLQLALARSRPDARIRTPSLDVVIETKRGAQLDEAQFRRHWDGLRETRRPTVLLALTDRGDAPLPDLPPHPHLRARRLDWTQVLALVCAAQDEIDDATTRFLLRQLEAYLRALGYRHFRGVSVNDVADYARLLTALAAHERATRPRLEQLLEGLRAGLPPGFKLRLLRPDRAVGGIEQVNAEFVNFGFLDAPGPARGRLRVILGVRRDTAAPRLTYYYTLYGHPPDGDTTARLSAARPAVEASTGPLGRCGPLSDTVFHVSQDVPAATLDRLLAGDPDAVAEVCSMCRRLFEAVARSLQ